MLRRFGFLLCLISFWLLLSGMFTPFLVTAGVGSAIAVMLFSRRMDEFDRDNSALQLSWLSLFTYMPWLIKEIVRSGLDVSWRVLHPALPIAPAMLEFSPAQSTDMGLVIHANSITLTPGTITVVAQRGRFLVHALNAQPGDTLADTEMDRRCHALEQR
ncbi:MAG: Na+/H+ antiporter subunit E [Rhodoferax sp.]|uniref:Na+/H+ antiporter subunit E n=1 Tax=Rhodoferax sp. TaxID=50421 RepID=UPI001B3D7346|nr:Na+/H+ antiporter subunit E [Rhodoferax sp.]MBP9905116.1 Na+/H+ antiporter subunit E [Rhodoferax sp.]